MAASGSASTTCHSGEIVLGGRNVKIVTPSMTALNSDTVMLLLGLLEQPVRVPSTTTVVSIQIQSVEDMPDQTFQYDDEAMRNGNGDPS